MRTVGPAKITADRNISCVSTAAMIVAECISTVAYFELQARKLIVLSEI